MDSAVRRKRRCTPIVSRRNREAEEVTSNDVVIGDKLLSHYVAWKRELLKLRKQPLRYEIDRSLLDSLEQMMRCVEQGIETLEDGSLKPIPVTAVFSAMTQSTDSIVRDAQTLHVSIATLKRYKRAIRQALGAWALRDLSETELQDMLDDVQKIVPRTRNAAKQVLVKL